MRNADGTMREEIVSETLMPGGGEKVTVSSTSSGSW